MRGSSAGIRRKVSASRLSRPLQLAVNAAPAGCASGLHLGTQFITLHQPFGSRLQHHWLAGDELGPRSQVIAAWLRTLHEEMARISQVKLVRHGSLAEGGQTRNRASPGAAEAAAAGSRGGVRETAGPV